MLVIYKGLRFIGFNLIILFLLSCTRYWWEEYREVQGVNWTPENSILFVEAVVRTKLYRTLWGGEVIDEYITKVYLWEVDTMGVSYRNLGLIYENYEGYSGFSCISCGGEWVVLSGHPEGDMYAIKRDLSERRYLGKGMWADLSPDGKKFVYVKPDGGGLWIKKIDGTGEHRIVNDPRANYPAWSSDGWRIACIQHTSGEFGFLFVYDTGGVFLDSFMIEVAYPDWGPADSNKISGNGVHFVGLIFRLDNRNVIFLNTIKSGCGLKWSPSGNYFIGYDGKWYVINRDGTNKWYIRKP